MTLKIRSHTPMAVCATLSLVLLSGCVGPIDLLIAAVGAASGPHDAGLALTPQSMNVAPENFRGKTCAGLALDEAAYKALFANPYDAETGRMFGLALDSIRQVRAEQNCMAVATSPVVGLPVTAAPGALTTAPVVPVSVSNAPAQGSLRVRVDAVSPVFAKSLGLDSGAGVMVIETEKGSPAEKAGLKSLDVILEVGGQVVKTTADFQAIVGRMRPGYKAPVRVWRQKASREVVVEVSTPAAQARIR